MTFRKKITLSLFLTIVLGGIAFAQVVEVPDPHLRSAIAETLNIPHSAQITQGDMSNLTRISVNNQGIQNLSGLEFANNLKQLYLDDNPMISELNPIVQLTNLRTLSVTACGLTDISPLSQLTNLTHLYAGSNRIVDVTPLANLTKLIAIRLNANRIVDITPLSNLTNLVDLIIDHNRIIDVRALAGLTQLQVLEIHHNRIVDHTPLDALTLSHFTYDQTCELPPMPLEPRLENRNYPSIFTRWGPHVDNRPDLSSRERTALHDLWYDGPHFKLTYQETSRGVAMAGILDKAVERRDEYLSINPHMLFIVDIRMAQEWVWALPEDWPGWIRDADGQRIGESPAYLMDFTDSFVQDRIVQQAIAVSKCGLYDGIFFDYWSETWPVLTGRDSNSVRRIWRGMEAEQRARDTILQRIRAETRPNFLIMGNTNIEIIPRTAPSVNGGAMETVMPADRDLQNIEKDLNKIRESLLWLDQNLREPRVNGLEGWSIPTEPPDSPNNRSWMRAITTLSLTHSDGYVVYKDILNDYHHWYDFWDADLGQPVGPKSQLYDEDIPGLYIREFTNGWTVYNHSGSEQQIILPELAMGVASRLEGTTHTLPDIDGEMYLRTKPMNPADVNGDGVVNILDLTLVAQAMGTDNLEADVNRDGVVNVFDLVFIANQF